MSSEKRGGNPMEDEKPSTVPGTKEQIPEKHPKGISENATKAYWFSHSLDLERRNALRDKGEAQSLLVGDYFPHILSSSELQRTYENALVLEKMDQLQQFVDLTREPIDAETYQKACVGIIGLGDIERLRRFQKETGITLTPEIIRSGYKEFINNRFDSLIPKDERIKSIKADLEELEGVFGIPIDRDAFTEVFRRLIDRGWYEDALRLKVGLNISPKFDTALVRARYAETNSEQARLLQKLTGIAPPKGFGNTPQSSDSKVGTNLGDLLKKKR
ncbi:hypothetical protein EPO33_00085 [Patescibacteria group bacterium]|nr:MAG: hypothetical protein EPO33_00085 [Patescibacteria group bacterium]